MATFLATPARRRLLLAGLLVVAAALIFQACEVWFAAHLIDSENRDRMERGVALLPGDADSWDRLGRYYLLNFADPDPARAIADYQNAVRLDPLSAHYWMDLASGYESVADDAKAGAAYEQARQVYPSSAEVAWNYGNFLLRENNAEGYAELQRAVRGDPSLLPLAISRVWHSSSDVNQLLNEVVPADTQSLLTTLDFFADAQNVAPGMAVWQRLISLHDPFPLNRCFPFLEALIRVGDAPDARTVWSEGLAATNNRPLQPVAANLISDGSFEADFPDGGLGWRWEPTQGTAIDFDAAPPSVKGRSIRLEFSGGTNLDLESPSQIVPVEPNAAYHFHALVRTEEISTDSGLRFYLWDPRYSGPQTLITDNLTGSHPWTDIDGDVATGSDTHFLVVRLHRDPSRFFDNRLSGTVWIADISLAESIAPATPRRK
jgi:tetratricopeptide (TPR) repeat protein